MKRLKLDYQMHPRKNETSAETVYGQTRQPDSHESVLPVGVRRLLRTLVPKMDSECPEGVALIGYIVSKYPESVATGVILVIMATILWTTGVVAAERYDRYRRRRHAAAVQGERSGQRTSEWRYQRWPGTGDPSNGAGNPNVLREPMEDTPPPSYSQILQRFVGLDGSALYQEPRLLDQGQVAEIHEDRQEQGGDISAGHDGRTNSRVNQDIEANWPTVPDITSAASTGECWMETCERDEQHLISSYDEDVNGTAIWRGHRDETYSWVDDETREEMIAGSGKVDAAVKTGLRRVDAVYTRMSEMSVDGDEMFIIDDWKGSREQFGEGLWTCPTPKTTSNADLSDRIHSWNDLGHNDFNTYASEQGRLDREYDSRRSSGYGYIPIFLGGDFAAWKEWRAHAEQVINGEERPEFYVRSGGIHDEIRMEIRRCVRGYAGQALDEVELGWSDDHGAGEHFKSYLDRIQNKLYPLILPDPSMP